MHPIKGTWRITRIVEDGSFHKAEEFGTFDLDIDDDGTFKDGRHHHTPDVRLTVPDQTVHIPHNAITLVDASISRVYAGVVVFTLGGHQVMVGEYSPTDDVDLARKGKKLRDGQEEGSWIGLKP